MGRSGPAAGAGGGASSLPTFVVLLRGVNVGKGPRVPMAAFRELLAGLGYHGVATLLNSGNAVFRAARGTPSAHEARISEALSQQLGVDVPVIVKPANALAAIVAECPVEAGAGDHSRILVAFTRSARDLAGLAAIGRMAVPPERFVTGRHAAYLFCASGIHESSAALALLGRPPRIATTRNWATTLKLHALANPGG
jgi:uncharacterized protein (DUF1697 family)